MWAATTSGETWWPQGTKVSDINPDMPEGTSQWLNNCEYQDVYEVNKYNCSFFFLLLYLPLLLSES